jgi:hypothetical protein
VAGRQSFNDIVSFVSKRRHSVAIQKMTTLTIGRDADNKWVLSFPAPEYAIDPKENWTTSSYELWRCIGFATQLYGEHMDRVVHIKLEDDNHNP